MHLLGGLYRSNGGLPGNVEGQNGEVMFSRREDSTMSGQVMDYKEKVLKELGDLSKERINEIIDFIGYLKSQDARRGRNKKIDTLDTRDNVLLSIVGIGESAAPHNLAQNHDKYAYGDL